MWLKRARSASESDKDICKTLLCPIILLVFWANTQSDQGFALSLLSKHTVWSGLCFQQSPDQTLCLLRRLAFPLTQGLLMSIHHIYCHKEIRKIHYNLNGSNPDGSFTLDDSNSFFSPYKILPIAQENKYLGIFSYFIMELYVVCTH